MRGQRRQQQRGLVKFSLPKIPIDALEAGGGSSSQANGADGQIAVPQDLDLNEVGTAAAPGEEGGGTYGSYLDGSPPRTDGGDAGTPAEGLPEAAPGSQSNAGAFATPPHPPPRSEWLPDKGADAAAGSPEVGAASALAGPADAPVDPRLPDATPPDIMSRPDGLVTAAVPPMDPLGLNAEIGSSAEPAAMPQMSGDAGIGGMTLTSPIQGEEMAIEEEQQQPQASGAVGLDGSPLAGLAGAPQPPTGLSEPPGSYAAAQNQIPESEYVDASVLSGGLSVNSSAGGAGGRTGCPGSIGRWHPSPSFDTCTNSASYPGQWDDNPALGAHLMHDSVDHCCEAVFQGGDECVVHNVCESIDLTYAEGFGADLTAGGEGQATATATQVQLEGGVAGDVDYPVAAEAEEPVVMDTPAVVKEATSAPLRIDAEADRSASPAEGDFGTSAVEPMVKLAEMTPAEPSGEIQLEDEVAFLESEGGTEKPVDIEADPSLREAIEEEAAGTESEIAEALAEGGVDEVTAEQLELEVQRAVENNDIEDLEDIEEELELIEEEEVDDAVFDDPEVDDAAFDVLDNGPEDEVFPASETVTVTEEGEMGYVPAGGVEVAPGSESEVHEDEWGGFQEDHDSVPEAAAGPMYGVDGLRDGGDGYEKSRPGRDVPYQGDGAAFQLLRPKGASGGGSSPFPLVAAGGLAASVLFACYLRRRRAPARRTLEYSALGSDDWGGTFSDDISFGKRDGEYDDDDGSFGSYGSDEEYGNGTTELELGSIHETDANGGLCLREVNG